MREFWSAVILTARLLLPVLTEPLITISSAGTLIDKSVHGLLTLVFAAHVAAQALLNVVVPTNKIVDVLSIFLARLFTILSYLSADQLLKILVYKRTFWN